MTDDERAALVERICKREEWLLLCERVIIQAAASFVPPITPEEYVNACLTGSIDGKPNEFRPTP